MIRQKGFLPIPAILGWVAKNYQIVLLGLMVAFIVGYIGYLKIDLNHWKHKAEDLQLVLNTALKREEALKNSNAALTRKYADVLADTFKQADAYNKLLKEKIANDKELASVRISLRALKLFNESKRDPTAPTSTAVEGDAAEADSAASSSAYVGGTIPLTAIFQQVAVNDENHWKCVKQVEAWQGFWKEYEANYLGVVNQ